jgi:pimeloyl-ACP methyl ester carboxylesterase
VTERVFNFGSHGGLVGILTEPAGDVRRHEAPAVICSNIGLNHRVGPNRLYVELARATAAAGFRSLRFDLSGFGDSYPRRGGGTDLDRAVLDTREAMDFLERRGSQQFILVGLCSGVDSAYKAALQDPRVVGVIFIDGYAYRNFGFWLRYCTVRNLQPARWKRFVRARLVRMLGRPALRDMDDVPEIFVREFPRRQQFAAALSALVARSVKMLFVYTMDTDGSYNYRDQIYDTFGHRDAVEVELYAHVDHVFSTAFHRKMLLSRISRWLDMKFPRPAATPASTVRREVSMQLLVAAVVGIGQVVDFMSDTIALSL